MFFVASLLMGVFLILHGGIEISVCFFLAVEVASLSELDANIQVGAWTLASINMYKIGRACCSAVRGCGAGSAKSEG